VERVDFVSAAGATPPDVLRRGHPSKLVTPKATFRFDMDAAVLMLDTIHPPWTLDDIRANTGFELDVNGAIPVTPAPSKEELRVLRQVIRRKMIDTGTYAAWAERSLGN
jgi:glutaconate CoA-transferase subunit B